MQDIGCKLSRTAAVVVMLLVACVGSAWGQYKGGVPWQVGDIIVCFGGGTCNVLRIVNGSPVLLDQFSDGLLGAGATGGVAINNSLHAVVTDNVGGNQSKVVVYSIASLDPNTASAVPHAPVPPSPFSANGGTNSNNAQAIAVNKAGHMFIGNAGNGTPVPSIVELNPDGTLVSPASSALHANPFTLPAGCTDTQGTVLNMDLSADGSSLYLTSGGPTIQQLKFSSPGSCTPFANFGGNVTLYGIKDIPAGALTSTSCKGGACPAGEAILVVAIGDTDPDALETGDTQPDNVNICTNAIDNTPVSCALLLDTNSNPGLTSPLWKAGTLYPLQIGNVPDTILDPQLHLQTVYTAGKSGNQEPKFSETGQTVIDNAVIWTNQGPQPWQANNPYSTVAPALPTLGTYIVDSNFNLETVTTAGISNPTAHPAWPVSGTTVDGLQWNDLGNLVWMPNTQYFTTGKLISDPLTHAQQVFQAGTSALTGSTPVSGWNEGGQTIEGVTWTESNPTWIKNTQFPVGTLIIANNFRVQQVQQAGTSANSGTQPNFNQNSPTNDNTVTWVDLGQAVWRPSFGYGSNAIIEDAAHHVQEATTPGISGPTQPNFADGASPGGVVTDGLQWQQSGGPQCSQSCPAAWVAGTQYTAGSVITDSSQFEWNAITAGTSGANKPAFESNETPSFVLADNAVVWTDQGLLSTSTSLKWQSSTVYAVNAEIIDSNQHVELVTVAGTSGYGIPSPAFVDGGTVPDNTVTWADLGQAVWRANFSYGLNAIIVDGNGNVQQVTTAGTTGGTQPVFTGGSGTQTPDGNVVWTNQGPSASPTFMWQANTTYNLNAMVVDSNNHVELATTSPSGTSGLGPNPPAFADGGSVIDGLIWADQGTPSWAMNHSYAVALTNPPVPGTYIVDSNNHLETVTIPGISGPSTPAWPQSGQTTDGLIWADKGAWQAGHQYFTLSQPVGDSSGHVHTVVATGTSGSGAMPAGGWNDNGGTNNNLTAPGITIDNAVVWTESHPTWQSPNHTYTVGNADTLILDSNNNVELVTNDNPNSVGISAVSGPAQPSAAGHNAWSTTSGGKTIDGLQWTNQANPASSVVARYPVAPGGSPVTTLRSLALDPLISDCTVSDCSSTVPPSTTSNFWLGDHQYANVYKLDFATGTPLGPLDANGGCPSPCVAQGGVQGIGIYGGEGSNQPGLTKVLQGTANQNGTSQTAFFPLPNDNVTVNTNSLTLSLYNNSDSTLAQLPPFAVYASSVPQPVGQPSCFFDGTGTPSLPCTVTTATGNAIVWKNDIPLNALKLPSTQTLAYSFDVPPAFQSVNNNVFVDSFYNTTTAVGLDYPSGRYPSSTGVGTPVNANGKQPKDFGCSYTTPVPHQCFQNPITIPVKFTCNKLPRGFKLQNFGISSTTPWGPRLQIVTPAQAPPAQFCTGAAPSQANASSMVGSPPNPAPNFGICSTQLPASNGVTTYRLSGMQWIFNWSAPPATARQTYHLCTYDDTHNAQDFCQDITIAPSCP